jgi:hypothetical protein
MNTKTNKLIQLGSTIKNQNWINFIVILKSVINNLIHY